jgi:AraC-like DNA-binding protein
MIHTKIALPQNPEAEVMHIGPDQLPYICICEPLDYRVDSTISWHWHSYFEVAYVAEGSLECRTPDRSLHLQKGEAVFINASVLHMYRKTSPGPCVIYAHIFDSRFLVGNLISGMYQKYIYPITKSHAIQLQPIQPTNQHQLRMLEALNTMVDLAQKEPFGYEFQLQNQLSQFWCRLLTMTQAQQTEPVTGGSDISRIKDMLHFIHGNYSRHITLKDIADAALISQRECSRCFQRCFHESAIDYLNKHRIRSAANMLLESSATIQQISSLCGFSSVSYFGKVFHQMLGCTPKEYRSKAPLSAITPTSPTHAAPPPDRPL